MLKQIPIKQFEEEQKKLKERFEYAFSGAGRGKFNTLKILVIQ